MRHESTGVREVTYSKPQWKKQVLKQTTKVSTWRSSLGCFQTEQLTKMLKVNTRTNLNFKNTVFFFPHSLYFILIQTWKWLTSNSLLIHTFPYYVGTQIMHFTDSTNIHTLYKHLINWRKHFNSRFIFTPLPLLQPICLATPSQVRSISCSAESDGRALLTVHIEGAKQVTS